MRTVGVWSSTLYATSHNLEYTLNRRQQRFQAEHQRRCTLVAVTIADGLPLQIPCFNHYDFPEIGHYIHYYRNVFADELCKHFPDIHRCCAEEIARTFMEVTVMHAATNHRCPRLRLKFSRGVYVVIEIHHHDHATEELARALRDSFEEVVDGARPMPATADSVQELLAARCDDECKKGDRYENGWSASEHECVICTDEIQNRRSSLAMECSHVFHEDCLIRWLKISHVCPLCRYEMPCDVL